MRPIILIPAYNPDDKTLKTINELKEAGFERIVVVDDGSKEECEAIFDQMIEDEAITLLRHAVNLGKGRALKTGFNAILQLYPDTGVVACDADGQHPTEAIVLTADALEKHPDSLIFGVRKFVGAKNIPWTSFMGNMITKGVFKLVTGLSFGDTQTGLRGFPVNFMKKLMNIRGERFEFENTMLLAVRSHQVDYVEVPMETVYINENETSHFNNWVDSTRIYLNILRYALFPIFSGLLSYFISLIWFKNIVVCNPIRPVLIYAVGLLAGWIILSFSIKKENAKSQLLDIGAVVLCTVIFYLLNVTAQLSFSGAWWLTAIVAAPLNYTLYLKLRYGKKPKRTKVKS